VLSYMPLFVPWMLCFCCCLGLMNMWLQIWRMFHVSENVCCPTSILSDYVLRRWCLCNHPCFILEFQDLGLLMNPQCWKKPFIIGVEGCLPWSRFLRNVTTHLLKHMESHSRRFDKQHLENFKFCIFKVLGQN